MMLLGALYLQDLMQVILGTAFLAPELFLLALNYYGTRSSSSSSRWYICAMIGGLVIDLRWVGVPGFCASLYVLSHLTTRLIWFRVPRLGRDSAIFVFINALICVALSWVRLSLWDTGSGLGSLMAVFAFQMFLTLPVLLILWFLQAFSHENEEF